MMGSMKPERRYSHRRNKHIQLSHYSGCVQAVPGADGPRRHLSNLLASGVEDLGVRYQLEGSNGEGRKDSEINEGTNKQAGQFTHELRELPKALTNARASHVRRAGALSCTAMPTRRLVHDASLSWARMGPAPLKLAPAPVRRRLPAHPRR
jgi:hypothetical protein